MLLRTERLGDRRARHRTDQPVHQTHGLLVYEPQKLVQRARPTTEHLAERGSERAHPTFRFALVRTRRRPARIDLEPARAGEYLVGAVQHRRGARTAGHPRFQIVDPHPQGHSAVPLEQRQVARVPRQLALVLAHPAELRPAVRQRTDQRLDAQLSMPDRQDSPKRLTRFVFDHLDTLSEAVSMWEGGQPVRDTDLRRYISTKKDLYRRARHVAGNGGAVR